MNDQPQIMNQPPPLMSQQPPPLMNPIQAPMMSQNPVLVQSQAMSQAPQLPPLNPVVVQSQMLSHSLQMMNPQRGYKPWMIPNQQNNNPFKFNKKPRSSNNNNGGGGGSSNNNWKGKNVNKQQLSNKPMMNMNNNNNNNTTGLTVSGAGGPSGAGGGYKPPSLNDLQTQNRMKARKYYYHPKKKFNNNRFAPYAPRNTTSFIIRAKKAGGIAELVSPCPVTPAVLPTPIFSPSREVLGDMVKEEWGVDGYGSMKGLIRLRSPGNDADPHEDEDEDDGNGSSESDVEEHVEVERRLDHDLSRFEMIYPNYGGGAGDYSYNNVLENRVDDQDTHIAQLEEENLTLKERLFLMERELADLRRRLQFLERQHSHGLHGSAAAVVEDVNEEVVENVSENDENESDGGSDVGATRGENSEDAMEYLVGNVENRSMVNDVKAESNDVFTEMVAPDKQLPIKNEVEKSEREFVTTDGIVKDIDKRSEEVENHVVLGKVEAVNVEDGEQMAKVDCAGTDFLQDNVVSYKDGLQMN